MTSASVADLGIATAKRRGGCNTAYHIRDGIFITNGSGIEPDASKNVFDVREALSDVLCTSDLRRLGCARGVADLLLT